MLRLQSIIDSNSKQRSHFVPSDLLDSYTFGSCNMIIIEQFCSAFVAHLCRNIDSRDNFMSSLFPYSYQLCYNVHFPLHIVLYPLRESNLKIVYVFKAICFVKVLGLTVLDADVSKGIKRTWRISLRIIYKLVRIIVVTLPNVELKKK